MFLLLVLLKLKITIKANCDTITFNAANSAELLKFGDPDNVSEPAITATNNVVSISPEKNACIDALSGFSILDFSSEYDFVADPNYAPLSEITNVAPIVSSSTDSNNDLIPESNLKREAAAESRIRKRKADKMSSKRFRNKRLRMLGREYVGFRKTDHEKFIQDCIKPARKLGEAYTRPLRMVDSRIYTIPDDISLVQDAHKETYVESSHLISQLNYLRNKTIEKYKHVSITSRIYVEKVTRTREVDEDAMASAMKEVLDKTQSIKKPIQKYGVKPTTLESRLTKFPKQAAAEKENAVPERVFSSRFTSNQVFTAGEEAHLNTYISDCSKRQYGLTIEQTKKLAYELAKANNLRYPSSGHTTRKIGRSVANDPSLGADRSLARVCSVVRAPIFRHRKIGNVALQVFVCIASHSVDNSQ
ncbi:hypothetical protein EVAR_76541_1 [Eumeta japonica]|uniref:Uncharacterized protein n=1 Tax=Eumeta variegata TaxID=151549 RepID=A0A4C1T4R5_EUMVA|nr:hypothetical protein EVAR_76541_1 [Eumeta japonica]